jgi:hypothetical protein
MRLIDVARRTKIWAGKAGCAASKALIRASTGTKYRDYDESHYSSLAVATLVTGTQAAWVSSGDDVFPQFESSYDRYAGGGCDGDGVSLSSGDDVISTASSNSADRRADKGAPAMVFPSSGDDVIWIGTSTRADRLASGASDPALSQ